MTMTTALKKADVIREYMSELGQKGGAVPGESKKRGNTKFYRELQLKAAAARKANNAERKRAEKKAAKAGK